MRSVDIPDSANSLDFAYGLSAESADIQSRRQCVPSSGLERKPLKTWGSRALREAGIARFPFASRCVARLWETLCPPTQCHFQSVRL